MNISNFRKMKGLAVAGAVGAALLAPGIASAGFVLDTGTPSGTNGALLLSSTQALAEEFSIDAGQTVTELSAYLNNATSTVGQNFTFDIYSNSGFISSRASNFSATLEATTTATWTGNGWTSAGIDWTATTTGDYWVVAVASATTNPINTLSAPDEASAGTGTVPALGFAIENSQRGYSASSFAPIGFQVTAVPLPGTLLLLGGGIAGLAGLLRRNGKTGAVTGVA